MGTSQENEPKATEEARSNRIDRNAAAGSKNSLGALSVRDGRPGTDDGVVEAIDEEGPGTSAQPATGKDGS
jgi:hypothetical protein